MNAKDRLITALDVETLDEAKKLVKDIGDNVDIYKVGGQLFTAYGPEAVVFLLEQGKKVFLDLKFHDIPNTVANSVTSAVGLNRYSTSTDAGLMLCTLHTMGGEEMMQRASEAANKAAEKYGVMRPNLVGITVLTSQIKTDNISALILERAALAKNSGLDGVVASSQEARLLRENFGNQFIVVTPGIRPSGADVGDQKRVTTPAQAIENGSRYLVVGRPIVKADDPSFAANQILEEIENALLNV